MFGKSVRDQLTLRIIGHSPLSPVYQIPRVARPRDPPQVEVRYCQRLHYATFVTLVPRRAAWCRDGWPLTAGGRVGLNAGVQGSLPGAIPEHKVKCPCVSKQCLNSIFRSPARLL